MHRDIDSLKEKSQNFVYDLARSDLCYYYKESIDGIDAVRKEAWNIYHSTNAEVQMKDRLNALRLIADCSINKFEMLNQGPVVLTMKSMSERLEKLETPEISQ